MDTVSQMGLRSQTKVTDQHSPYEINQESYNSVPRADHTAVDQMLGQQLQQLEKKMAQFELQLN